MTTIQAPEDYIVWVKKDLLPTEQLVEWADLLTEQLNSNTELIDGLIGGDFLLNTTDTFTGVLTIVGRATASSGFDALTTATGIVDVADATAPTVGQALTATSSSTATWQDVGGAGDVFKVGTPVANQVGYWTGDGTLAGDANFTFDPSAIQLTILGTLSAQVFYLEEAAAAQADVAGSGQFWVNNNFTPHQPYFTDSAGDDFNLAVFKQDPNDNLYAVGGGSFTTGVNNFVAGTGAGAAITGGDHNIAIGLNALGALQTSDHNIAIGENVLPLVTSINGGNTAIGYEIATASTNLSFVTIVGGEAGALITTGDSNTLVGFQSGNRITTGVQNTAVGTQAFVGTVSNTTGNFNTAIGALALTHVISASNNVAVGHLAGTEIDTGSSNTCAGDNALSNVTSGTSNVAIGVQAGRLWQTSSAANIAIGRLSGPSSGTIESNKLYINNGIGTPMIGGDFSTNLVTLSGAIQFTERADHIGAPTATFGELWLRNGTPNALIFTDDAGTDFDLTDSGGDVFTVGTPADNQIGVWTGDGTLEGDANLTWNGTTFTVTGAGSFTGVIIGSKGADVASAAALPLITDGNYVDVTGTTTITSINSVGVGVIMYLHFDGALQITNGANIDNLGGANITTVAGDEAVFIELTTGVWRMIGYTRNVAP